MPEEIEFNFKPTEALDYFRQRDENKISWSYTDVWEQEHKRSFTVAKMTQATLLDDIQKSLDKAIAEGQSYEQWRDEMLPRLDGVWLGRTYGDLWEEMSPEEQARHDPPTQSERSRIIRESRLKTIFRTNMFSSYQAGRYRQLRDDVEDYPYWRYVTMEDASVRPTHAEMHGKIFRWDDPFWQTYYPPNGYNCRCEVEGLDDFDLEAQDLTLESGQVSKIKGADGKEIAVYTDAGGKTYHYDKGWGYCVGQEDGLKRAIEEKNFPAQLQLQLDQDLQRFEIEEEKVTETPLKVETTPQDTPKATPQPTRSAPKPKPKRHKAKKPDRIQQQEQAILDEMEQQAQDLEKLLAQL